MKFIKLEPVYCVRHGQMIMHKMFSNGDEYVFECDCGHIVKWNSASDISREEFLLNYKDENSLGSTPKRLSEKIVDTKTRAVINTKKWWEKMFDGLSN